MAAAMAISRRSTTTATAPLIPITTLNRRPQQPVVYSTSLRPPNCVTIATALVQQTHQQRFNNDLGPTQARKSARTSSAAASRTSKVPSTRDDLHQSIRLHRKSLLAASASVADISKQQLEEEKQQQQQRQQQQQQQHLNFLNQTTNQQAQQVRSNICLTSLCNESTSQSASQQRKLVATARKNSVAVLQQQSLTNNIDLVPTPAHHSNRQQQRVLTATASGNLTAARLLRGNRISTNAVGKKASPASTNSRVRQGALYARRQYHITPPTHTSPAQHHSSSKLGSAQTLTSCAKSGTRTSSSSSSLSLSSSSSSSTSSSTPLAKAANLTSCRPNVAASNHAPVSVEHSAPIPRGARCVVVSTASRVAATLAIVRSSPASKAQALRQRRQQQHHLISTATINRKQPTVLSSAVSSTGVNSVLTSELPSSSSQNLAGVGKTPVSKFNLASSTSSLSSLAIVKRVKPSPVTRPTHDNSTSSARQFREKPRAVANLNRYQQTAITATSQHTSPQIALQSLVPKFQRLRNQTNPCCTGKLIAHRPAAARSRNFTRSCIGTGKTLPANDSIVGRKPITTRASSVSSRCSRSSSSGCSSADSASASATSAAPTTILLVQVNTRSLIENKQTSDQNSDQDLKFTCPQPIANNQIGNDNNKDNGNNQQHQDDYRHQQQLQLATRLPFSIDLHGANNNSRETIDINRQQTKSPGSKIIARTSTSLANPTQFGEEIFSFKQQMVGLVPLVAQDNNQQTSSGDVRFDASNACQPVNRSQIAAGNVKPIMISDNSSFSRNELMELKPSDGIRTILGSSGNNKNNYNNSKTNEGNANTNDKMTEPIQVQPLVLALHPLTKSASMTKGPLGPHQSSNTGTKSQRTCYNKQSSQSSPSISQDSDSLSTSSPSFLKRQLEQTENLPPSSINQQTVSNIDQQQKQIDHDLLSKCEHKQQISCDNGFVNQRSGVLDEDEEARTVADIVALVVDEQNNCCDTRSEDGSTDSCGKIMDYQEDGASDDGKAKTFLPDNHCVRQSDSPSSHLAEGGEPADEQMVLGSPNITPPPSEDLEDNSTTVSTVEGANKMIAILNSEASRTACQVPDIPIRLEPICDYYFLEARPFARGKFAQVKRCINKTSKQCFAAKCIKKRRRLIDIRHEIMLEIEALKLSYYTDRIVKLYEVYETQNEMILVLEMANGGELQRVLDDEESIDEVLVKRMVKQILEGLVQLHDNDIAHLDIKPQNLLLTESFPNGNVKLCDFGISRRITKDCEIREICGTPDYVAPEILRYDPIGLATDMWSLGVLTYVLLSGYSPFGSENKQQTFCNITQAALDFPSEIFDKISKDAIDFIQKLIVREPAERLTSREARGHPWLRGL